MAKTDIEKKKCLTPEFRVSFPAIFQPKAFDGQEAKYQLTMLFSKKTDITALKKAAFNAAAEKWGPKKEKWPKFKHPWLRDGDDEKGDVEGYEGCVFVSAKSKTQPGLVDHRLQPITAERDFYAGCYARAEVLAYAYDSAGNKGVGFALQNIQKLRDGDRLSGRKDAEDVFDAVDSGEDDEENYGDDSDSDGDDDSMYA